MGELGEGLSGAEGKGMGVTTLLSRGVLGSEGEQQHGERIGRCVSW